MIVLVFIPFNILQAAYLISSGGREIQLRRMHLKVKNIVLNTRCASYVEIVTRRNIRYVSNKCKKCIQVVYLYSVYRTPNFENK